MTYRRNTQVQEIYQNHLEQLYMFNSTHVQVKGYFFNTGTKPIVSHIGTIHVQEHTRVGQQT